MWGWKALLFIVVLNMTAYMVGAAGVIPYSVATAVPESVGNYTSIENWTPVNIFTVGDIVRGFYLFIDSVRWAVDGFPTLLDELGTPAPIVWFARTLVGFIFAVTLIQFISGRRFD